MIKRDLVEDFLSREIKFTGVRRELIIESVFNKVTSIVGPRRSGKTWYLYFLYNRLEKPMYVNFEDIAFRELSIEEFFDVIKIFSELKYKPRSILLDEIQTVEEWETLVRSLQDRDFKVFITGSSSKLLPKEISTELRGRSLVYLLLPFSFREFLNVRKIDVNIRTAENVGSILKNLREYLNFGGFPEVILSERKERILKEYFDAIFYKDFVERHEIKSLGFGRFLLEFVVQNFSKEFSIRRIRSFFGKQVSYTTLYNYVDKLQDTLTIFFLNRYSAKVYLRRAWPKKVYICDTGISRVLQFSEKIGDKMENAVFLDLKRRQNESSLLEIFYLKDYQQNEVDFVLKEGLKVKQLIQVTYASGLDEVEKRELRSLVKASEELKCRNLTVITWDLEDKVQYKGSSIKLIPLWKWLLQ